MVASSILFDLKESKMSQKKLIKVRIFPGATIQDIRFFVFQETQGLRKLILKYLPSARIVISTPALHVDKVNANRY